MENHFGFWALKSPQTRMNTKKMGWTSKVSTPDGIPTVRGYNAPCFDGMVHDLRR